MANFELCQPCLETVEQAIMGAKQNNRIDKAREVTASDHVVLTF